MASAFASIQEYSGSSCDEDSEDAKRLKLDDETNLHLKEIKRPDDVATSSTLGISVWAAPPVDSKVGSTPLI